MAGPLVELILTNKWSAAVPILQIACFIYMFYPIHLANLQIAKAVGRTDISMWQEIAKKLLDIVMLVLMVRWGLLWVAVGLLVSSTLALWINIEPNNKFIHYNTLHQLWDVLPSFIIGTITATIMYVIGVVLDMNCFGLLMLQIVIGALAFIILTFLFNKKTYMIVKEQIVNLKN